MSTFEKLSEKEKWQMARETTAKLETKLDAAHLKIAELESRIKNLEEK